MAAPWKRLRPVKEFSAHIHQELIRSTPDDYPVFHIILRKVFAIHHFLKKADISMVTVMVFDCMFGCGSGSITFVIYHKLKPFGSIMWIPVTAIVTFIFVLNGFIYDGIWNKFFQALITKFFMLKADIGIQKDFFMFADISYDRTTVSYCNEERCLKCHKLFPQSLLSSTKICICVCESCPRRLDECTKCQSSPCTGTVE